MDAGDLSPRLAADPSSAAELRTLADSFNHMLDRLEDAFARQRGFVSDASHELRSPLTAIRGQIEVLARQRDPDAAAVHRVETMTLAELGTGRTAGRGVAGAGPARRGRRPGAARTRRGAAFLRDVVRAAPGGAAVGALARGRIDADPDLVARVVRNLVENARRHAGPEGTVKVSSATVADSAADRRRR